MVKTKEQGLSRTLAESYQVLTDAEARFLKGDLKEVDLKEVEARTLRLLEHMGIMIVGDIRRVPGVLPAQMSRIIRSLEGRDRPLIERTINQRDKRKINVEIKREGKEKLEQLDSKRMNRLTEAAEDDSLEDEKVRAAIEVNRALTAKLLAKEPARVKKRVAAVV